MAASYRMFVSLTFVVVGFSYTSLAHPAFQHHFNNIVNANPCLKRCMDRATENENDLTLLKTANISGFLLDLDNICSVITTAKECIAGCGVNSNPFALESMNIICSEDSKAEVRMITQCLSEHGETVLEKCSEDCGDYDEINDEVHRLTKAFRPEENRKEDVSKVMKKIGVACSALKCVNRCTVKELSQRCARTEELNSMKDAGSVVQSLVQRVLAAQRKDLERMRLVDTLAQSTPSQCAYMYMPEVMFDPSKDEVVHAIVNNEIPVAKPEGIHRAAQPLANVEKKSEMNLALSQLQTYLLKKQMQLLLVQEKNLMRESEKLDMEMDLLARRRAKFANFDAVPYDYYRPV